MFLNYVNPMAMITGYVQRYAFENTVGLCHSVQTCVHSILKGVGIEEYETERKELIAGINHQAWLLKSKISSLTTSIQNKKESSPKTY